MQVIPVCTQANELSVGETADPLKARVTIYFKFIHGVCVRPQVCVCLLSEFPFEQVVISYHSLIN